MGNELSDETEELLMYICSEADSINSLVYPLGYIGANYTQEEHGELIANIEANKDQFKKALENLKKSKAEIEGLMGVIGDYSDFEI